MADALGVPKLRVIETGGDEYQQEREQWDDGNNVVALEPGVVVAYERNTYTIAKMRKAGVEVITIEGFELGQGPRRRPLHDVSVRAGPAVEGARDGTAGMVRWVVADRGRGADHGSSLGVRPEHHRRTDRSASAGLQLARRRRRPMPD